VLMQGRRSSLGLQPVRKYWQVPSRTSSTSTETTTSRQRSGAGRHAAGPAPAHRRRLMPPLSRTPAGLMPPGMQSRGRPHQAWCLDFHPQVHRQTMVHGVRKYLLFMTCICLDACGPCWWRRFLWRVTALHVQRGPFCLFQVCVMPIA
jgi:hypothetical protein